MLLETVLNKVITIETLIPGIKLFVTIGLIVLLLSGGKNIIKKIINKLK